MKQTTIHTQNVRESAIPQISWKVPLPLGGPFTPQQVQSKLQTELDRQEKYGHQYWPIFLRESGDQAESGTFAGAAGLRPFHDQPHVRELGVHIARPFWSHRLGAEAASAVIQYAFNHFGLDALAAGHHPENTHSQALLQRLGFTYTHHEPWGPGNLQHPFYRLARAALPAPHAPSL